MAFFKETCALTSEKCVSEPGMIISNLLEKLQFFWSRSPVLAIEKKPKDLNFSSFLTSKISKITFGETVAPSSRKNVAEQGMCFLDLSKKLLFFCLHSPVFLLEKNSKHLNFSSFLSLKYPLVATFSEMRASTYRKYVVEQGKSIPDVSGKLPVFWLYSSGLALEK